MRWLAELVGFPHPPAAGLLTSGASMATITALATARHQAFRDQGHDVRETGLYGHRPMALYVSAEAHSCLRKAAELLGLGTRYLRTVPVDSAFRMDTGELRRLIAADQRAGVRPFFVAASAGTVNTGAVDPLDDIAAIALEHRLWFHVDGAYGALGILADDAAPGFAGLERADSLALDPHKWLGVPVDAGCILFREPAGPRDAFSLVPPTCATRTPGSWAGSPSTAPNRPARSERCAYGPRSPTSAGTASFTWYSTPLGSRARSPS
ncbi:hypothetical protein SVIO_058770 [Streptomyces violaceusniger]|uniref:Amino acid decarboxylase n=1 Tax=Streptomyces violaceusniger TaxID=68280 RepID=A0A4D4L4C1_STRVO|nr:hypothetical protein SVIO_058770 [Streptomyces violaceusniger]